MAKTKAYFAEMVLRELSADPLTSDHKIFPREVYPRLDAIVNDLAKKSFFTNWEFGSPFAGENYLTTWGLNGDQIIVTDPDNEGQSFFDLPVPYVELPLNGGVNQIIPMSNPDITVIITTLKEYRLYKNTPAGSLQGRLAAYPVGNRIIFNQAHVKQNFGDMMVRLVIRDSSVIPDSSPYPISPDVEHMVIAAAVKWFKERLAMGSDVVRDGNTQRI